MRCIKCGEEIYLSNEEFAVEYGECWHTVADDESQCFQSMKLDVDGYPSYEHRPVPLQLQSGVSTPNGKETGTE